MADQQSISFSRTPIPAQAGIGLRADHYRDVVATPPPVGFLEVHSENYFGRGGAPHRYLNRIRRDYPLSMHGVGLSLGSTDALDPEHLNRLKTLVDYYQPDLVSEHLSWGSFDGRHTNDLLPLPYTEEAARHLAIRVQQVQDFLQREILVENVSCYLEYNDSALTEWEFVAAVADTADCGVLLDVNNIFVNACNHGFDRRLFAPAIPAERIKEIHLAGHTRNDFDDGSILIDTHNRVVCDEVWDLYRDVVHEIGPRPTLIEWDTDLPALDVLVAEAQRARDIISEAGHARVA